jgi:hypothetical protein
MSLNLSQRLGGIPAGALGMMNVTVDGKPFSYQIESTKSLGDLIELIKSSIDPDTIIIKILMNENFPTDSDWKVPLAVQGNKSLEILTGSKQVYVDERLSSASLYLDKIIKSYGQARIAFKSGEVQPANTSLTTAVQDTKAFIDWYQTILQLIENPPEAEVVKFEETVTQLTDTCEQILQQQLYRSWWQLADLLERKLEPQLEQMKYACLGVFSRKGNISNQ